MPKVAWSSKSTQILRLPTHFWCYVLVEVPTVTHAFATGTADNTAYKSWDRNQLVLTYLLFVVPQGALHIPESRCSAFDPTGGSTWRLGDLDRFIFVFATVWWSVADTLSLLRWYCRNLTTEVVVARWRGLRPKMRSQRERFSLSLSAPEERGLDKRTEEFFESRSRKHQRRLHMLRN